MFPASDLPSLQAKNQAAVARVGSRRLFPGYGLAIAAARTGGAHQLCTEVQTRVFGVKGRYSQSRKGKAGYDPGV